MRLVQVKPSLQREIMAHAEVRTMQAQIQRNTPLSYRLMAEDGIPGAPPVPNVDMLMDKKTQMQKKRSTIKAATTSADVFDKFEKGIHTLYCTHNNMVWCLLGALARGMEEDEDSDDGELQFAKPTTVTTRGMEGNFFDRSSVTTNTNTLHS